MPSHKLLIPSILKNITPILENLIEKIAEDNDLDARVMKKKYLNDLRTYKKKVSRRKGIINAYAAFLGDKEVEENLRKDNPDATFGELSKLKGPLWKSLSEKEREIYKQKAIELTKANLEALKSDSLADEEITV
jgi:hypothetical protein